MSEWILIDADQVVELGELPSDVESRLLDILLAGKLSSPNAIVDIGSPHDISIAIGISCGWAYVEFGTKDGDPPYYRVVNPLTAKCKGDVVFSYKGERTLVPAKNCVTVEELAPILKHFIATESIPEWIITEEA